MPFVLSFISPVRCFSDSRACPVTFDLQVAKEDFVHCSVVLPQCEWQLVVLVVSLKQHTDLFSFLFLSVLPSSISPPYLINLSICLSTCLFSTVPTPTCSIIYFHPDIPLFHVRISLHTFFLSMLISPNLFSFHPLPCLCVGVPVNSRVSSKIQQLLNTLKRPKRPPLREFFVDDFEELLDGKCLNLITLL